MFDLPVVTEKERKIATKFRNFLLDDGYIMMQFSVYSRICKNNDDLNKHINKLKINAPKNGNIRLLQITENQYNNMIMFCGEKRVEEEISTDNLLIFEYQKNRNNPVFLIFIVRSNLRHYALLQKPVNF